MDDLILIFKDIFNVKVIDASIDYCDYVALDLSVSNKNLDHLDMSSAQKMELFIENYLVNHKAKVAFGGYNEKRNLYKRSSVFNHENVEERNIHIGLDLWIKAGTDVLAALDGKVHSFQNNTSLGDYGPAIILKHTIHDISFYTLYGHLSEESLGILQVGKSFSKGEKMATLGNFPINGDYSPHLHFQIIKNMEQYQGDYPGVCSENTLDYYLTNCPDPNLLLKID